MKKKTYYTRTVGVLARIGKVLDDLAEMGYMVAELASWVGPTSAETAQAELIGPQRLVVTQQTPSQGQGGTGRSLPQAQLSEAQAQLSQAQPQQAQAPPSSAQTPPAAQQAATLTQEEVGLLSQHQVTYQNARAWVAI